MIYFETSRLRFRDWDEADLEPFRRMNADEQVMKFFPRTLSEEETDTFYHSIMAEFKQYGFGLYAVEAKESGEFIGFIGFRRATFEAELGQKLQPMNAPKGGFQRIQSVQAKFAVEAFLQPPERLDRSDLIERVIAIYTDLDQHPLGFRADVF